MLRRKKVIKVVHNKTVGWPCIEHKEQFWADEHTAENDRRHLNSCQFYIFTSGAVG